MASDRPVNVGVIGYGLSAKVFHIPFVLANPSLLTLHSILQRNPSASASAPADHPTVAHHTDLAAFLADPSLDLVIITTPPASHHDLAAAALRARKHVLVEKPFVPTVAQAKSLAALADAQGRLLCVYQNRRWDADFLTLRRLVASGALGDRIVELETHFDRFRPQRPTNWKADLPTAEGGGPLFDLGTHLIDQVYVLLGMPSAVYAKFAAQREGALDVPEPDSVTALLSYDATGAVAHVRIGVLAAEARPPRFRVRGSGGTYRKAGLDPQEPQLRGGMAVGDPRFGREGDEWAGTLTRVVGGGGGELVEEACPNVEPQTYGKLFEGFARAIQAGKKEMVPVPAEEATDVLRIIEAVIESAKTGSEVRL